jgi:hypothetical protein
MAAILDELKLRHAEAQKRLVETTQAFQLAQQAQQAAQMEANVWHGAVQAEMRKVQLLAEAAQKNQMALPNTKIEPDEPVTAAEKTVELVERLNAVRDRAGLDSQEPVNQTEAVRELLRRHPGGMTPSDIWREVSGQFKYRAYLYSVLKRLRDREEVVMRRKKYALKAQQEAPQPIILQ